MSYLCIIKEDNYPTNLFFLKFYEDAKPNFIAFITVFKTVWFVRPSQKPEINFFYFCFVVGFFFNIGKQIFITSEFLTLPQSPIVLKVLLELFSRSAS